VEPELAAKAPRTARSPIRNRKKPDLTPKTCLEGHGKQRAKKLIVSMQEQPDVRAATNTLMTSKIFNGRHVKAELNLPFRVPISR
jgi:hypothetical protein